MVARQSSALDGPKTRIAHPLFVLAPCVQHPFPGSEREKVGRPHRGTERSLLSIQLHHVENDDSSASRQAIKAFAKQFSVVFLGPDRKEVSEQNCVDVFRKRITKTISGPYI